MRKIQASAIDFSVSVILFIGVFFVNEMIWRVLEDKFIYSETSNYFELSVHESVNELLSEGQPWNWEENISSTRLVGLCRKTNFIKNKKLEALIKNYTFLKDKMFSQGEFQIIFTNGSNEIKIGPNPIGNQIIRVERLVIINDSYYKMIFYGWKNE